MSSESVADPATDNRACRVSLATDPQSLRALDSSARYALQVAREQEFLGKLQQAELHRMASNREYAIKTIECVQLKSFSGRDFVPKEKRDACDERLKNLKSTLERLSARGMFQDEHAIDEIPFLKFLKQSDIKEHSFDTKLVEAMGKWAHAIQLEHNRVQWLKLDDLQELLGDRRLVNEVLARIPPADRGPSCLAAHGLEDKRKEQATKRSRATLATSIGMGMGAAALCALSGGVPCLTAAGLVAAQEGTPVRARLQEAEAAYSAGRICAEDLAEAKSDAAVDAVFAVLSVGGLKGGGAGAKFAKDAAEEALDASARSNAHAWAKALSLASNRKDGFKSASLFHQQKATDLVERFGPRIDGAANNEEALALIKQVKTEVDDAVTSMKPDELYSLLEGWMRQNQTRTDYGSYLGVARDKSGTLGVSGPLPESFADILRDFAKGASGNRDLAQIANTRYSNLAVSTAEEFAALSPKLKVTMIFQGEKLSEAYAARGIQELIERMRSGDAETLRFLKREGFDADSLEKAVKEIINPENRAW